jgi:hypothetical protein
MAVKEAKLDASTDSAHWAASSQLAFTDSATAAVAAGSGGTGRSDASAADVT